MIENTAMDDSSDSTVMIDIKRGMDEYLSTRKSKLHSSNSRSRSRLYDSQENHLSMRRLIEVENEERQREAELTNAKATIHKLQSEMNELRTSHKRARVEYEQETVKVKSETENDRMRATELEAIFANLTREKEAVVQELSDLKADMSRLKTTHDEKMQSLIRDRHRLTSDLTEAQESSRIKVTSLKNELMRQQTETQILENELEETKEQLQIQIRKVNNFENHIQEIKPELQQDCEFQKRIKDLEVELEKYKDDAITVKALQSKLARYPEIEKENIKLKDEIQRIKDIYDNIHMLKEQNEDLKQQLIRIGDKTDMIAKLTVENDDLKSRLQHWEVGSDIHTKNDLVHHVADLQAHQALLLEKQGALQSSTNSAEEKLKFAEDQIIELKALLEQSQQHQITQADQIKRYQRKLLLIQKERDGYKQTLDAYESELTVNVNVHSQQRIKHLELTSSNYQRHSEIAENDLAKVTEEKNSYMTKCIELEAKLKEATSEKQESVSESDQKIILQLREKIAELEDQIEGGNLKGDYDPRKTKVLHFTKNPAAVAQKNKAEELSKVKEENEKMKAYIKKLEERGALQDISTVQEVPSADNSKAVEELKSKLSSAERKNQRLMEAFKQTSQDLRQACYHLTGYKVDVRPNNQFRVMNMYAESAEEYLLFQKTQQGEMQLLETEYGSSLEELLEKTLYQSGSIPVFLSSLTLDLFSRQTLYIDDDD